MRGPVGAHIDRSQLWRLLRGAREQMTLGLQRIWPKPLVCSVLSSLALDISVCSLPSIHG